MKGQQILERLVYLDTAYISGQYELSKGVSPQTNITRTESVNAGVRIPLFSGGASSTESKAYAISTLKMLVELSEELQQLQAVDINTLNLGKRSSVGWLSGILTIYKTTISNDSAKLQQRDKVVGKKGTSFAYPGSVIAEETYFGLQIEHKASVALVTSPEYFSSGIDAFLKLKETVIDEIGIPVKALVRIYSAQSQFKQWVAVPYVIIEIE